MKDRESFGLDRLLYKIRFFDSNTEWSEGIL